MEKLEAALNKAREMRQTALRTPLSPGQPAAATRHLAAEPSDWAALPVVTVPVGRAQRSRISVLFGGKDATPYDLLRSRTVRSMKEKDWTRVAITSPGAACGKTTVSLNLAISMARQKDLRIMLFDIDLRRPSLHKAIGHHPKHSFHEVLDGSVALEDVAVRIGDNLIVVTNAVAARHPSELLQSASTREVLDAIEKRWKPDVMIFDTSPMLASDDNVGFLANVDCALLVAAAESTTLANIDLCEKDLAQLTNVLGVVLNKCRYADESIGYDYGVYG